MNQVKEKRKWNPEPLNTLIKAAGMSSEAAAQNLGISLASLYHYCRGEQIPGIKAMVKIADYFAVPLDYLLGRCTREQADAITSDYAAHFMELRRAPWEQYLVARRDMPKQYIGYTYEAPWPYNLLDDLVGAKIYGHREHEEDFWDEIISDDQMNGLNEALASLTLREQDAIKLYYQDGLNLEESGKHFGVTKERVRQIIAKAVRKLRHPSRLKLIQYGAKGVKQESECKARKIDVERQMAELEELEREIYSRRVLADIAEKECGSREKRLNEHGWKPYAAADGTIANASNIMVEDMELSVRSYNCLKRAGVNNLADLMERMESGGLLRVRNLGHKSIMELCEKVKVITGRDFKGVYGLQGGLG